MHCLQEMWKRALKTQNIVGGDRHENDSRAASGFWRMDLNLIGLGLGNHLLLHIYL